MNKKASALLLLALLASGCAAQRHSTLLHQHGPTWRTIWVVNDGIDQMTIRVDGVRIGLVEGNTKKCLRIPTVGDRDVAITASSMHGKEDFRSSFRPVQRRGWEWRLGLAGPGTRENSFPIYRKHPCSMGGSMGYVSYSCRDDTPFGYIRIDVLVTEEALPTLAHEWKHIEQADKVGCQKWNDMTTTRNGKLELESEAFCAGAITAVRYGRFENLHEAIWHYARWLSEGYVHGLSHIEAAKLIHDACSKAA